MNDSAERHSEKDTHESPSDNAAPLSPTEAETFLQLKTLMLGDEQKELAELREKLTALEDSLPSNLSENLPRALRDRQLEPQAFKDLVTSLQPGTVSAIQQSVNNDKEPLTKALFPIIGPAIRTYVLELFRGMAEELNQNIQNATSAERIKWRFQAKMAGKPYSEYVLLKTRSLRIEEAYLIQKDTGLLVLHAATDPANEASGEADLVSGMFTAIRSFVKDSFTTTSSISEPNEEQELDRFTFGEREVLIEVGPSLVLAAVVHGVPSTSIRDELKQILEDLHTQLQPLLEDFSGDTSEVEFARPTLRQALIERSADNPESASGGGLWRAWLALGLVALLVTAVLVVNTLEQRHWNRFEKALRAEPGVAVTQVERTGWWRKRIVAGLRDPLSQPPNSLAKDYEINPERTNFQFRLVQSLEEKFIQSRQALAEESRSELLAQVTNLQSELQVLRNDQEGTNRRTLGLIRSLLGDISNLETQFDNGTLFLSGDLSATDLALVQSRIAPLTSLYSIDTSKLSNDSVSRIKELRLRINETAIGYQGGTLAPQKPAQLVQLIELLQQLTKLTNSTNQNPQLEILSHPLIGNNRSANRVIEQQRADRIRQQLIAEGLESSAINVKLSENPERAGQGISLNVTLTPSAHD